MLQAVFIMGGLGVVIGIALAAASKIFYVYVDPKVVAVDEALPGANCGGCGFPGCTANAEAIVAGQSPPNSCVAAGEEVAEEIAAILGVTIEAKEPDIARPGCYYGVADADTKYVYNGLNDCRAAALLSGGMKICTIGCLGLGTCVRACPFNAITMGPEGLPVVDPELCTGCGTCERICPKHIINLSSVTRRILKEYTTDECTTPCQRACPAGIDIREYIHQIQIGDYPRSVQVIKERNPFPTVIGRICPRPCEESCRRQYVDEPVAINFLKRFAADYEKGTGQRIQPYKAPDTGRRVAVVGGGVEGLSTAFFSARLGHGVTLFEATEQLGGLLRSAIAKERLPREILDWDIQGVLEMGVEARTGTVLGRDFTVDSLLAEGYQAVFLAAGGWDSRLARSGPAEIETPLPGTYLLIDLIRADSKRANRLPVQDEVAIVGGQNVALRAARICKDLGVKKVTVLFREKQADSPVDVEAIEALMADEDGIEIVYQAAITKLYGQGSELTGLEYTDEVSGEQTVIHVNNLFLGAGRFPELICYPTPSPESEEDEASEGDEELAQKVPQGPVRWTAIECYKKPAHKDEVGLLSEGDELTDYKAAIRAIAGGRRGAAAMHFLMYDMPVELPDQVVTPESYIQNVYEVENVKPVAREIMPVSDIKELARGQELEKGFSEQKAHKEAARCLQCGLICYERTGTHS